MSLPSWEHLLMTCFDAQYDGDGIS